MEDLEYLGVFDEGGASLQVSWMWQDGEEEEEEILDAILI